MAYITAIVLPATPIALEVNTEDKGSGSCRPGIILDSSGMGNRATISLMGKA
jgi:hypothetical protein